MELAMCRNEGLTIAKEYNLIFMVENIRYYQAAQIRAYIVDIYIE